MYLADSKVSDTLTFALTTASAVQSGGPSNDHDAGHRVIEGFGISLVCLILR